MATFEEEISDSYELGVKGLLLDNHLRFTLALFYQEFKNHQIGFPGEVPALDPIGGLFNNQLGNANEVFTRGVEFDVTYVFAQHWEAALRGAYSDPTIEDWNRRLCEAGEESPLLPGQVPFPDQLFCPKNGKPLNALPRWQTNFQLAYEHDLGSNWNLATRLNWTWQSKPARQTLADSNKQNIPSVARFDEAKSRFDVSLVFFEPTLGLELKLWAKNLTNEDLNTQSCFNSRTHRP